MSQTLSLIYTYLVQIFDQLKFFLEIMARPELPLQTRLFTTMPTWWNTSGFCFLVVWGLFPPTKKSHTPTYTHQRKYIQARVNDYQILLFHEFSEVI